MKLISKGTIFIIALLVFLPISKFSFAQIPDTVKVYANYPGSGTPTIEEFIMADTTATGEQTPNRVYLLQQTGAIDTPYYYQASLYPKGSITIIGKTNPTTGMPPVIQPWKLLDNTSPGNFIIMNRQGTLTLKNLYILGQRYDSVQATGTLMNISGSPVKVILDHLVIDNISGNVMTFTGTEGSIFVTNCEMRNCSNQFWRSGVLMWANSPNIMDTVVISNNTFFLLGRSIIGGPYPYRYLLMDHNTLFLSSDAPIGNATHQINATITNNIFFGAAGHGIDSTMIVGAPGPGNDAHEPYGIIMTDSLKGYESIYGITEQQRNIVVKNNVYSWPQGLYDMWNSINDTATGWYIAPPTWMNPQTATMFSDKTDWPNLVAENNDSTDPGFDASLVSMSVDSLVKFEKLVGWRTFWGPWSDAGSFRWWQYWTNPYPGNIFKQVPSSWKGWQSGYPVPENMRYSNTSLQNMGTDGKALGDLNWFPEQITGVINTSNSVPEKFELSQNYPNPFNPTTTINYSISTNEFTSLKVYNILGQEVSTLFQGYQKAGTYKIDFNASNLASGIYFYRLQAGNFNMTRKMILMK